MRAAALLLTIALAGCLGFGEDTAPFRARQGDFAIVDLWAFDAHGREVLNLTAQRAVLATRVPPRLPEGWDANGTLPLPAGVTEALRGKAEGAALDTGLLQPEQGFGPWDPGRAIKAPLRDALPRELRLPTATVRNASETVCDPTPGTGSGCAPLLQLRWANATWHARLVEERNGTTLLRMAWLPANGTVLELPDYWNERYQLWRSRIVGSDEAAVRLEHLPEPGRTVQVGGVAYRLAVEGPEVVADSNHPLARERVGFRVVLRDLVFPAGNPYPPAQEAFLVRPDGSPFNLTDLRGKPALLDFFATWCVTCKQQAPALARAKVVHGANLTVVSITIDPTDTPERLRAFQQEAGLPPDWAFAFDPLGQAAKGFSVATIPREVVLDADLRVRASSVGVRSWPALQEDLAPLLAG